MEFQFTLGMIGAAIIKLFIIMSAGYALHRFRIIDDKFLDMLSMVLVRLIFPALIIAKTVTHFSFAEYGTWWFLPLVALVFAFAGMAIGGLIFNLFKGFPSRKEFISSCGFQNCGYLPMNLILFAFAGAVADKLLIYVFLYIVGFNLLMWSLVPLFLSGTLKTHFRPAVLFNPPVVATIFSLLWVAVFGKGTIPGVIMDPMRQLGQSAFPIAMLTLGGYLSRYSAFKPKDKVPLAWGIIAKLAIFPALVLLALKWTGLSMDYKFFIFLQATMPTAVSLVVIGSYTGADNAFFSSIIFYTHLIAIFTIPLWLGIFRLVM